MNFSKEQLIDMTLVLRNSAKNCFLPSKLYAAQFSERSSSILAERAYS